MRRKNEASVQKLKVEWIQASMVPKIASLKLDV